MSETRRRRTPRADAPASPAISLLSDDDLYLFNEGSHVGLAQHLGAHPLTAGGVGGTYFAVWAPNAAAVSVVGDFNGWAGDGAALRPRGRSGIWEGFVPGVGAGALYKYRITGRHRGYTVEKADPFAFRAEAPPRTGSVVWDLDYDWGDGGWMASRGAANSLAAPIAIYELHAGSWRRQMAEGMRSLGYRELAVELADYVASMGFTHVEFLPLMEHPFFGSWGYQTTGYFAPTSRYGTPQDLMYLIDRLHQRGIGVILDWVPSHFPTDEHGLGYFDGTHLYEHADRRQGFHPDWKSFIFNYGRPEVRSFLLSNALFWLDAYHADGLRVDAVASMLYLDYSRKAGEWVPNRHGGRENLDAIAFLRRLNEEVYRARPDVQTYAEESTAWPMVSRPTYVGGLGFGAKWDMGWMHDTLRYMSREPVHRRFHQNELTFRSLYAFNENFVLPLSHDEVVHGKRSLLDKMPGDAWQKHANLRLLFGYMYGQAGKKLLFMGDELAQDTEWHHDESVAWHLRDMPLARGVQVCVRDLNRLYASLPALHELDCDAAGFEWVDASDAEHSIISFLRHARAPAAQASGATIGDDTAASAARAGGRATAGERDASAHAASPRARRAPDVLVVCNFTPVPRHGYRVGVPAAGIWRERLNTDAEEYGGSGQGNFGGIEAQPAPAHGRPYSLALTVPPLAAIFLEAPPGTVAAGG